MNKNIKYIFFNSRVQGYTWCSYQKLTRKQYGCVFLKATYWEKEKVVHCKSERNQLNASHLR